MYKERIIELPKITDQRGTLSFAEIEQHIPFCITQVVWGADLNEQIKKPRGVVLIALTGRVEIMVDGDREYVLDQSQKALFIPDSLERTVKNSIDNPICLVISSDLNQGERGQASLLDKYTVADCSLVKLSALDGNVVSTNENIPFDIKRVFYISDIPVGEERGMHVHKLCHEILIAAKGQFDVELDDGINKKIVTLDNPAYGLHIPPGIWAVEKGYSEDVICLVLASDKYDSDNYINTYSDFIKYRQDGN